MKHFNLQHETLIFSELKTLDKNPKDGEMVNMQRDVNSLSFYQRVESNRTERIYITKDFIVDLYNQIQEIEKETVQEMYLNMPF